MSQGCVNRLGGAMCLLGQLVMFVKILYCSCFIFVTACCMLEKTVKRSEAIWRRGGLRPISME